MACAVGDAGRSSLLSMSLRPLFALSAYAQRCLPPVKPTVLSTPLLVPRSTSTSRVPSQAGAAGAATRRV